MARIKDDPNNINAGNLDGLGCCYHMQGKYNDALTEYDNAIDSDNKNTEFLMHRSQCYFDMKNFEQSIKDLKDALVESKGTNPQILYKLGLSYYSDEKFKDCVKTLKLALQN